ncbi:MAG: ABC transporter permease subunit [Acidimicrobiales bacterium]
MHRPDPVPLISRLVAGAALLAFVGALPWLSRRDPAATILRARYAELEATPEALEAIRAQVGLEGGPLTLSARWWSGVLRGDLGTSWVSGSPVGPGVIEALGVSAMLAFYASIVAVIVMAALVTPSVRAVVEDRPVKPPGPMGVVLTAMPEFLLATVLLVVFGVLLNVLPPFGWSSPQHLVLPSLALGLPAGGLSGRLLADAVVGSAGETWVDAWRLAGAPSRVVALGVLRRAGAAVVDQMGLVFVGLLGGAVAVEQVFAIPGIGRLLLGAANAQDLPALQAGLLLVASTAVGVGILAGALRRFLHGGPLPAGALRPPPEPVRDVRAARRVFGLGVVLMAALLIAGLPRDPFGLDNERLARPSWRLPLGADASGRDVLARVAHGAIDTLLPAVAVVAAAMAISLVVGFATRGIRGPVEIANATPPIIAGVVVAALSGPSTFGAALAVLWVSWPPMVSHAAALIEEARAAPHIRWLPVSGVGRMELSVVHILPAIIPALGRHALIRLPGVALALASLGFLGLGARPPQPDWGLVLSEGIDYVERAPWATAAPAAALALASVLAVSAAAVAPERRHRARVRAGDEAQRERIPGGSGARGRGGPTISAGASR